MSTIEEPRALRSLPRDALAQVARELRDYLIAVGAEVGGHFAGSLGVVELTVALHTTFDTPHDRIVWDVGHQGYGHKALTGRRQALRRVKKADGPAGFLRRVESPYDAFGAGHAGTSVSAALGMAEGAARQGARRKCVAVIGDGAATAGMSFEALNHAGHLGADLRVVLNDNGMSIAPNVGGLHRTGDVAGYARALGLRVLGPVDGHDLDALLDALAKLRDEPGPSLLHVRTNKGRGYAPAERDPFRWHATAPFEVSTGTRGSAAPSGAPSWTAAFAAALGRVADRDPRVVALTAAMPDGTGLDRFAERHPDRVYDVGIAEQHGVTFAAGLATEGLRPVCAIYSSFLQRGYDQVIHDVALQNLPVTFALDRAGVVGADGPTHHGAFDVAYLRTIPNLVIAAPRDENDLQHLLATGVASEGPFALRFPRGTATGCAVDPEPKALPIGRGELLRDGTDVALVAIGGRVPAALEAADRLAARGLSAAVADARFVKPLDDALLCDLAQRVGRLVTIEDHALAGGFGSAVLELLCERVPESRVHRLGLPDRFVEHGDQAEQLRAAGLDADGIAQGALRVMGGAAAAPRSAADRAQARHAPDADRARAPLASAPDAPGVNGHAARPLPSRRVDGLSPAVREAYAHCAAITRRSHSSFLAAFWMFPREQRRALHAVYAFCRLADDIADDPAIRGDRALLLARWRDELADAYRQKGRHPVGIALGDAVHRFRLREDWFLDLLAGIESDLSGARFETFGELERYCYQVASTVGLIICGIRGLPEARVRDYAVNLGIAVQLTNVLRDVGEDAAQGRVYLAHEDLRFVGVAPERLADPEPPEALRGLLALYAQRARIRYERAGRAMPADARHVLRPAQAMGAIYRDLLDALQARGFPCQGPALRLSKARRMAVAARGWLAEGRSA